MRALQKDLGDTQIFEVKSDLEGSCCPDCRVVMNCFEWDAVLIEICPRCCGSWLSDGEWGELDWRAQQLEGGGFKLANTSGHSEVECFIDRWRSLSTSQL